MRKINLVNKIISSDDNSSFSDGMSSDDSIENSLQEDDTIGFAPSSPFYYLSMMEHLNNIDSSVSEHSQLSGLCDLSDEDYYLDQMNKKFIPTPKPTLEVVRCAVIVFAHAIFYPNIQSEYMKNSSLFLSWRGLQSDHPNEYPIALQGSYKNEYLRLSPKIRIFPFISPSVEKMNSLKSLRREVTLGRVLFHFVGYGFPTDSDDSLIFNSNTDNPSHYTLSKLFESFCQPSWFIFDCDNAGAYLNVLQKTAESQKTVYRNPYQDDWFCFCATSAGEQLPQNRYLPRDFLTTCLFTPIPISILCHILKYYQTSFSSPNFPLSKIDELWESSNEVQLDIVLSSITGGIAADYFPSDKYQLFFHQDNLTSNFFRRFILAQYLLSSFEVYPISHPYIPNTTSHPLWMEWELSLDLWVMSTIVPRPTFASQFFSRSLTTMSALLSTPKSRIDQSLLSILLDYPLSGIEGGDKSFIYLVEYCIKLQENREKIASIVMFNDLFSKLIAHDSNDEEYQALSYLILSLLQLDLNFSYEIHKDLNLAILPSYIFDDKINEITRATLAAILASIVNAIKTIRLTCASSEFITAVKDAVQTAKNPILILWMLILLKRSFSVLSADYSLFYNTSSHIQVSICIFHKAYEVRAAVSSALSCFMQSTECLSNFQLILFAISAFNDMSYLVRYQLLLLLIRFLSSVINVSTIFILKEEHSFNELFHTWFKTNPKTIEEYAKAVDSISHLEDSFNYITSIAKFLILYFSYDPHPSIKDLASRAYKQFTQEETNDIRNHSISPPFISMVLDNETFEEDFNEKIEDDFESDSDALFNIAIRQFVNYQQKSLNEEKNISEYNNKNNNKKLLHNDIPFGNIEFPTIKLQLEAESNFINEPIKIIKYEPNNLMSIIATNNEIYSINEDNTFNTKYKLNKNSVTSELEIMNYHNEIISIISTNDGCCHLWNPSHKNLSVTWRCDINYLNDNSPLHIAVSSLNNKIIAGRDYSAISLWDLPSQRLINEYKFEENHKISTIASYPNNNELYVVGYDNGIVDLLDIRCENSRVLTISFAEKIAYIKGNRTGADLLYIVTESGRIIMWNKSENYLNSFTLNNNLKNKIRYFDTHFTFPLLAVINSENAPIIASAKNGKELYKVNELNQNSVVAFHPILPMISFGTEEGRILSYNIVQ